jgi:hypothetical protein
VNKNLVEWPGGFVFFLCSMGVCNVCLYIVNRKMNFCVLDDSRPRGKLERTYSTNTVWDSGMGGRMVVFSRVERNFWLKGIL